MGFEVAGYSLLEWLGAASAAAGATAAVKTAGMKPPGTPQKGKSPDAGMSPEERRNKLLAQLAAGAARNNPSGGLAGNPNVGSVKLGQ